MIIPNYDFVEELAGNDLYALHKGRRIEDRTPVFLKTPRRNPQSAVDVELTFTSDSGQPNEVQSL
jgi:hypothetical protein